jgi:glycosyltransferase involved in cell wall biosynthesis
MPVYNTEAKLLKAAIDSVINQIYENWELCIVDDASTEPHIREILESYAVEDKRIKIKYREENGHISVASNSALEMVTGDFITFLDHDDELTKHALFWTIQATIDTPDAMVWYSDEDKLDEQGNLCDPYFKPDWNLNLFLSNNYITHLLTYRTWLVKQVNGFRENYEGAQDYDLALRVIEHLKSINTEFDYDSKIHHIPRVLYHWRITSGSTAMDGNEKPYAVKATQKAVSEYLERQKILAKVSESTLLSGALRVQYELPKELPLVSIIIPTYNGFEILKQCINSILNKTNYTNYEILIIDNNSDDYKILNYFKELLEHKNIEILKYKQPFNYAAINNWAVKQANGEIICLLNNDIEVISRDWLGEMVSHALRPEIGAVGARLWYPDDKLQHGGVIVGLGGIAGHSHKYLIRHHVGYFGRIALIQNLSAVTAACMVLRKEVFTKLNGLEEKHLAIAFNDVDFCLRIKEANLQILWTPYADLYHHESASRGDENTPEKAMRFKLECNYMKSRWGESLLKDPAYSPNLTLDIEDFSYAWPPRVTNIT